MPPASPGPPPRRHWGIWAAAVIVVVAVLAGGTAYVLSGRSTSTTDAGRISAAASPGTTAPSTTTAAPTTTTASTTAPTKTSSRVPVKKPPPHAPTAKQVASDISSLLSQSAKDRQTAVNGAAALNSCGNVSGAGASFTALISHRSHLLSTLQGLNVNPLPGGSQIKQDLVAAWNASVRADQAYETWAQDDASNCTQNQAPDPAAVGSYNALATQTKTRFAQVWNPVASRYGLPTVTPQNI